MQTNESTATLQDSASRERRKKRNLNNEERQAIFEILLKQSNDGNVKRGSIGKVASIFSTSSRTVRRIWRRAKGHLVNGTAVDVSSQKTKRVGRKRIEVDLTRIRKFHWRRRTNIRSLAKAMDLTKSTIHRRIKDGVMRPHTNALKPYLTDENKIARLRFCLSMLESGTPNNNPTFIDMANHIHIDKKWFYMTQDSEKYYLLPDEDEPLRTCKSKQFITKVMFLAVVARPRFDSFGNEEFSGKIGIFPFTYKEAAKRSSKNRAVGTMETKAILSVTKDVVRSCLIEKVLPKIRAKWPRSGSKTIYIQQDNARPHIDPNDVEFLEAANKDGFEIKLIFQPPNSPDMNVLDLGFFRAIQSLQYQEAPNTKDELLTAVEKSFNALSSKNLNHIFLTLQMCMIEVLKVRGGNKYKLSHMGKAKLEQEGRLPLQIQCDREIIREVLLHLQEYD